MHTLHTLKMSKDKTNTQLYTFCSYKPFIGVRLTGVPEVIYMLLMKGAGSARAARGGVLRARAGVIRNLAQRHLGLGCVCWSIRENPRWLNDDQIRTVRMWCGPTIIFAVRSLNRTTSRKRCLYIAVISANRWDRKWSTTVCGFFCLSDPCKKLYFIYFIQLVRVGSFRNRFRE